MILLYQKIAEMAKIYNAHQNHNKKYSVKTKNINTTKSNDYVPLSSNTFFFAL